MNAERCKRGINPPWPFWAKWGAGRILFLAAVSVTLFLTAGGLGMDVSRAEPYMTVREGYKCSKCHVNKTGGGMRTDYAKVYMNTRMAMKPSLSGRGEDDKVKSNMASSRLSKHFSVNADLRADAVYTHRVGAEASWEYNRASTSGDCAACHSATTGGGKRAEVYLRAELEPDFVSLVFSQSLSPVTGSREMYAVLDVLPLNGYVKVGTFRLPTGVNNTFDEPFYHINQQTGARVPTLETVRGNGVEVGIEPGPLSLSLSLTNPTDLSKAPRGKRILLSGYAVTRLGMVGAISFTEPLAEGVTDALDENRKLNAIYLGANLGRFTVMVQRTLLTDTAPSGETKQETGLAQLDFLIFRGQNLKLQYEFIDPDKTVDKDIRDRTSLIYEPFLTPYLQMRIGYRKYDGPTQSDPTVPDPNNAKQFFLELHLLY